MGFGDYAFDGFGVFPEPPGVRFDIERDLLCTAGADGHFSSLNAAWELVLGWTREELMARPFIEFVHPDDVARTEAESARIGEVDRELVAFDNRFRTTAGDWRWLRWNARTDGETWFSIAFDVTERKRAEDRLRAAIDQDRLLAYSQPIIDQRSGTVVQEELLARLRSNGAGPQRVMPPAEFLPEAERSGLIRNIDHWMTMRGARARRPGPQRRGQPLRRDDRRRGRDGRDRSASRGRRGLRPPAGVRDHRDGGVREPRCRP